MNISLREITADNWVDAIKLKVDVDQEKFVASNAISIAQSKFHSFLECYGIYNEDTMVGFTAFGINPEDDKVWIARYMIDGKHQGKGYGKVALESLLQFLHQKYACSEVFLDVGEENTIAKKIYSDAGFAKTGMKNGESPIYKIALNE